MSNPSHHPPRALGVTDPTRMPVLYLSHGAPPLADDQTWTRELRDLAADLPRPESILMVSAHWESAPVAIGATEPTPLTYDFSGFPRRFYDVEYDAPGAPDLAREVAALLARPGRVVHQDSSRGLDHGAYVPLVEMYPDADVPVLQVSMPSLDPGQLFAMGQALAPLRDQGTLVVGSGFATHNLREMDFSDAAVAPQRWVVEFDDWLRRSMDDRDVDAILNFAHTAPAATRAHPRSDHFAPLFLALGAATETDAAPDTAIDGYWHGMAKRSFVFT